jgi:hypothetical protein
MLIAKEKLSWTIWDKLELGLGAGATFRVLLHVMLNPKESHTVYALVKATGIRTPAVQSQIKTLLKLGWVVDDTRTPFSPVSYYVNLDNPIARLISDFLWILKYQKGK